MGTQGTHPADNAAVVGGDSLVMFQKCGTIIFTYGKVTRKLLLTPNERCWGLVELRYAPAHSPRPYDHCCWRWYCCHDVLTVWLCSLDAIQL
jgi:hypothetical protein